MYHLYEVQNGIFDLVPGFHNRTHLFGKIWNPLLQPFISKSQPREKGNNLVVCAQCHIKAWNNEQKQKITISNNEYRIVMQNKNFPKLNSEKGVPKLEFQIELHSIEGFICAPTAEWCPMFVIMKPLRLADLRYEKRLPVGGNEYNELTTVLLGGELKNRHAVRATPLNGYSFTTLWLQWKKYAFGPAKPGDGMILWADSENSHWNFILTAMGLTRANSQKRISCSVMGCNGSILV
jgi:hypothetical protein